jgi:hypothetical protein
MAIGNILIRPMQVKDFLRVSSNIQEHQKLDVLNVDSIHVNNLIGNSIDAFSFIDDSEEAVACMGIIEISSFVAYVWSIVSIDIGSKFVWVHKGAKAYIDGCGYNTVLLDVRDYFGNGSRWAKMLGFTKYCVEENYYGDGGTAIIFKKEID